MRISPDEQLAIKAVIKCGQEFGFGNMIAHLQTAWAKTLIIKHSMSESAAREASCGTGFPFAMQDDLIERGEWDETGVRYFSTGLGE